MGDTQNPRNESVLARIAGNLRRCKRGNIRRMAKTAANEVLTDADKIIKVWDDNPTFSMGEVTAASFKADRKAVADADADVEAKRLELTPLLNVRDAKIAAMAELITRALSGIRPTFGPDSSQYEQAGGTRKSEPKPAQRKPN